MPRVVVTAQIPDEFDLIRTSEVKVTIEGIRGFQPAACPDATGYIRFGSIRIYGHIKDKVFHPEEKYHQLLKSVERKLDDVHK